MSGWREHQCWGIGASGLGDECSCQHPRVWHSRDGSVCEFHCGNPERCRCTGFKRMQNQEPMKETTT